MERQKSLALGFGAILLGIASTFVYLRLRAPKTKYLWVGQEIPLEGLKIYPASWNVEGNPEYAVEDLKRTYIAIDSFRKRFGRFPQLRELLDWDGKHPGPGKLTVEDWTTPDMRFRETSTPSETNDLYAYNYRVSRPDGKAKPAFPKPGEKDVWAYCTAYVRHRQTVFRDRHSEFKPSGVYVVLWSDGSIEKVPTTDVMIYPLGYKEWEWSFKGQTGLPKSAETWKSHMTKESFNEVDEK